MFRKINKKQKVVLLFCVKFLNTYSTDNKICDNLGGWMKNVNQIKWRDTI